MIKADGKRVEIEGSFLDILNDAQMVIRGVYDFLVRELGDDANEVLALLGQFAIADDQEEYDAVGRRMAQLVVDSVTRKIESEVNDGKETC